MKNLEILILLLVLILYYSNEDYTNDFSDASEQSFYSDMESYSVYTDYYFDSSKLNNNTIYSPNTKILLLGFENYQIIQNIISFNVIFKKIYGNIFPKKLIITIHIVNGILRNLEEETKIVVCPRISNDNEDNIKFYCSKKTNLNNITNISADKNFSLVDENGNAYDNLSSFLTGFGNRTIGNLQNENGQIKDFIILENSRINIDEPKFNIFGYISENIYFILEDNVSLFINDKENIKEIPCFISNNENSYFELECSPNHSISFHIDNVYGAISDKNLIISMKQDENDYINITITKKSYDNRKVSNKGLTGGAIAGIVIGCVFTVIF